ncbi:MAG TPA: hypothetical protein VLI40_00155 [Gemmatimonadaceae bacterium]|nr:hypothetical protein [Gemmatimonadaceae bacterium]
MLPDEFAIEAANVGDFKGKLIGVRRVIGLRCGRRFAANSRIAAAGGLAGS